jgi:CRISPR-associated protein Cas6
LIDTSNARVPQVELRPSINVSFSLSGQQLPADHGYLVYSAISRSTSSLHGIDWLAIELISGFPAGRGLIALSSLNSKFGTQNSELRLRIPADHYRDVLPLAGKRLDIGGHQIRLGLPVARPLEPAPSLYARVVTIKKFTEPEPFLEAVKRKLASFGIKGRVELPREAVRTGGEGEQARYRRRIITIHGKSVVGFSVAVHELSDEDSLLLQAGAVNVVSANDGATQWQSIFSRRAMGCGIFNPILAEKER